MTIHKIIISQHNKMYKAEVGGKVIASASTLGVLIHILHHEKNVNFLRPKGYDKLKAMESFFEKNVNFSYTYAGTLGKMRTDVKVFFIAE